MFVAIGFEHSVTNMFILPAAMMLGRPFVPTFNLSQAPHSLGLTCC